MNITESTFYVYVGSATNPEGSGVFSLIHDDIEVAKSFVVSLLGTELYDKLTAAQDDPGNPLATLCVYVERYICCAAYDRAIPSLDLVLTPTGFGVVSNGNVAPASSERVARLRRQIRDQKEAAFDDMLGELRGNADWCESDIAKRYFSSLIWSGAMVRNFGFPNEGRTKLAELTPDIAAAERELIHIISPDLHMELTGAIRTNSVDSTQEIAINLCRGFIYAHYTKRATDKAISKGAIISFLDDNIEHFPDYYQSSAYRANHYKPYENEKDDSCYFFG